MKAKYTITKCYRVDVYNEEGKRVYHKWRDTKDNAITEGERLVKGLEEDPDFGGFSPRRQKR